MQEAEEVDESTIVDEEQCGPLPIQKLEVAYILAGTRPNLN